MSRRGTFLLGLGVFIWVVYKAIDRLLMPVPNGLALIFTGVGIVFVAAGAYIAKREK